MNLTIVKEKIKAILIWSQRLTGTDMIHVARGSFWLLLWEAVTFLFLFITSVVLANLLSQEEYGHYRYIITLFALLNAFTLTGMNTAVTRSTARGEEGSLEKTFIYQLKWNSLAAILSLGLALYYLSRSNHVLFIGLLAISLALPIIASANTFTAFLLGKKRYQQIFVYNSLLTLFTYSVLLISLLFSRNAAWLTSVFFMSNALGNLFFYLKTKKTCKQNNIYREETVSYGRKLSQINFLSSIAMNLDKALLFHSLGAASLAVYNISTALPEQARAIYKIIPSLVLPRISASQEFSFNRFFWLKVGKLLLASILLSLIYVVICPPIYHLFFPGYGESIFYSRIYALGLMFVPPTLLITSTLQSLADSRQLYKFNLLSAIVQLVSLAVLLYFYGIIGLVFPRVITSLFSFLYSIALVKNHNFLKITK